MPGWMNEFLNMLASIATVVSVIFLALQIRAEGKISKTKLTFEMIEELEGFITQNHKRCIYNIIGDLQNPRIPEDVLKENKSDLYDVLNFFERLSIAQKVDAINTTVLVQMYGARIREVYDRLEPYIWLIQNENGPARGMSRSSIPYQHFTLFGSKLKKSIQEANIMLLPSFHILLISQEDTYDDGYIV